MFELNDQIYNQNRASGLAERLGNQNIAASQQEMQQNQQSFPGKLQEQQQTLQAQKIDNMSKQIDATLQLAATATDQPSYDDARRRAQSLGIDTSSMPAQFDPQYVQKTQMQLLSAKDRLTAAAANPLAFSGLLGGDMMAPSAPLSSPAASAPSFSLSPPPSPSAGGTNLNTAIPTQSAPASSGFVTGITPKNDGRNWDILKRLPPQYQPLVKSISEGGALPGNISRSSSQGLQLMSLAGQFDPTFNGDITHTERNQTMRDYASGGKSGQSIKAINQVLGHTDQLYNQIDKLGNTGNTYWNEIKNYSASHFSAGSDTATAISRFDTIKKGVVDEMTRAWRGTGGAEADIQERLKPLQDSQSPEQLKASLSASVGMLGSAIGALQDNFSRTMGPAAENKDFLTQESKIMLRKLRGDTITPEEQSILDKFNQNLTGGPNLNTTIPAQAAQGAQQPQAPSTGEVNFGTWK